MYPVTVTTRTPTDTLVETFNYLPELATALLVGYRDASTNDVYSFVDISVEGQ